MTASRRRVAVFVIGLVAAVVFVSATGLTSPDSSTSCAVPQVGAIENSTGVLSDWRCEK